MKTKLILALFALFGVLIVSCEKPLNSPPVPQYSIALEVVDQNGKNLLSDTEKVYAYCEAWEQKSNVVLRSGAPISKNVIENVSYLNFGIAYGAAENCPAVIVWKIKCKEIFSDEKLHDVTSSWQAYDLFSRECTSFEFEGKTYTPQLKNGYWTARVVVNR